MAEEYAELSKQELLYIYKDRCQEINVEPHSCLVKYLEETMNENEALEIVIQGNHKYNFNNRVDD